MKKRGFTAFVSEWSLVEEYAREGRPTKSPTWIRCAKYPLDHDPASGNLFFVPREKEIVFEKVLHSYIWGIRRAQKAFLIIQYFKRVPGTTLLYRFIKTP
jgi:hypothetical protein